MTALTLELPDEVLAQLASRVAAILATTATSGSGTLADGRASSEPFGDQQVPALQPLLYAANVEDPAHQRRVEVVLQSIRA